MNKKITLALLSLPALGFSQSVIGNINSGAISDNTVSHSVGEIYVIPTDPDQTNSGTMGMLYQTVLVLGINELETETAKIFPNPTSDFVQLKLSSKSKIETVEIFDQSGRMIIRTTVKEDKVDLRNLPTGIYIMTFGNQDIKPIKIIKKP